MCDDGAPPAKRTKYNLRSYSKSRIKQDTVNTISETKLLDLNDDCFNVLFDYLNVIELGSVAHVSERLKQLTNCYFKRKYSEFDFSKLFGCRLISCREAKDMLRNFGPMIKSMSLSRPTFHNHGTIGYVEDVLLKNVVKYCDKTMHSLKLVKWHFTSRTVTSLNMLSKSLKSLTLDDSVLSDDCLFHLSNFTLLRQIIISNSHDCGYALMDTFPSLEWLELTRSSIPKYVLQHFFLRHSQLEVLIIENDTGVSSDVVRCIVKYLRDLDTLSFDKNVIEPADSTEQIQRNMLNLSKLKGLKGFIWDCQSLSIGNLLAKMVSNKIKLEYLHIHNGLIDDQTLEAIVKMKGLKALCFYGMIGLNNEHLIKYANELTQLKELGISYQENITAVGLKEVLRHTKKLFELKILLANFRLDLRLYNDILDIVKERRNGPKLKITIYSADEQVLIPQEIIRKNSKWILIQQIRN